MVYRTREQEEAYRWLCGVIEKLLSWRAALLLLLIAWIRVFIPDAVDVILRQPPSDGAGMAFVIGWFAFVLPTLHLGVLLIVGYRFFRWLRRRSRPLSVASHS